MTVYRGSTNKVQDGLYVNPYLTTPRRPLNTHLNVHSVADKWFEKTFGVRARSQTIFCTRDVDQAKQFSSSEGAIFQVSVPVGKEYSVIFSEHVDDFNHMEADIHDVDSDAEIEQWLESKSYQMVRCFSEIPIDFMGELMLFCTEYEAVNV